MGLVNVHAPDGTVTVVDYDPCGECPKGICDQCSFCEFNASFAPSEDDGSTQPVESVP